MTDTQESWPFDSWCRIAVKRFGLAPSELWAMPVREWLTLVADSQRPGFDRQRLDDLIQIYPDGGGDYELTK